MSKSHSPRARMHFGIRARLVSIVLVAMLPLAGLLLFNAASERGEARARARKELQSLAVFAAGDLEARIQSTNYLLRALEEANAVRDVDEAACGALLDAVRKQGQRYTGIGVVDANGELLCGSPKPAVPVNWADRDWFRRTIETRAPTLGGPRIGGITQRASLPVSRPILGADGRVEKILLAAIDLHWFGERFSRIEMLPGLVALIWDADGRIVFRYPDSEELTGTPHRDANLVRLAKIVKSEGILESPGFDGVHRIYAIAQPASFSGPSLTLAFGAPTREVDAPAVRGLQRNLTGLALMGAAIFALAWWLSEIAVRRPVMRVADASARLRAGDLSVRAAGPIPSGEIGVLMSSFNAAAAMLEARTAKLQRTNRTLRTLSECNQALVRATSEQQLLQEICGDIVEHGGYRFAWVGYAESDDAKRVQPVAHAGFEDGYLSGLAVSWADDALGRGPVGTAIRTGRHCSITDIGDDPRLGPWRVEAVARGYASAIAIPLMREGRVFGSLNVYSSEVGAFGDPELEKLLLELAGDLAYGIGALRMQATLRNSETRFRSTLDAMLEGCQIIGFDWRYLYINDAAVIHNRRPREELLGRLYMDMWPGIEATEVFVALTRCMNERVACRLENRFSYPDASDAWFELDIEPVPEGIFIHSVDITERKRAEEALRAVNQDLERRVVERTMQLEEASRAKSDFLANMSHELRTPLNAIIGFSEMLKDGVLGDLDDRQRGFVNDIFESGAHLLSLINDILDLSKVEAGMLQRNDMPVDVLALLKSSTLVVREKALANGVELRTELESTLGTIRADERKLKQIVYNLLANAVKFTPEGGTVILAARRCVRAEVALDRTTPGRLLPLPSVDFDEYLEIDVSDTGIGIAEQDLSKLFEPFVQLDDSTKRHQAGTGLGLSLVRRLVELHDGTVGVSSRVGLGSRFTVWIPYLAVEPMAKMSEVRPAAERRKVPLALVIEDEDVAAQMITAQLRDEGFDVMRASTAEEGLVRAAKSAPDLITLDIFLPGMDGWDFLQRLKADPALASIAVVIISVSKDTDRGIALGARRVLQKPFTREELVDALAGIVDPAVDTAQVLVVDDNAKAVELVATMLEAEGFGVIRAYGGAEALEAIRVAQIDLVILDLMMPEVDGFEVARAMRESGKTSHIPILILTAKNITPQDHERLNGKVAAVLAKSTFSRSALVAELRRAVARQAKG